MHAVIMHHFLYFSISGQPAEFMGASNSSTSITFTWKPPRNISGIITNYTFQCSTPGAGVIIHNLNFLINSSLTTTTLSGFLPYTSYSCSIIAHTSAGGGPAATVSVTTLQDGESKHILEVILLLIPDAVPSGPPQDFVITATSQRTLTLSWSPPLPSQHNGVIISYLITCSSGGSINSTRSIRSSSTNLTITGLQPFTNYTCTVSAATMVGDGPAAMRDAITSEASKKKLDNFIVPLHS